MNPCKRHISSIHRNDWERETCITHQLVLNPCKCHISSIQRNDWEKGNMHNASKSEILMLWVIGLAVGTKTNFETYQYLNEWIIPLITQQMYILLFIQSITKDTHSFKLSSYDIVLHYPQYIMYLYLLFLSIFIPFQDAPFLAFFLST